MSIRCTVALIDSEPITYVDRFVQPRKAPKAPTLDDQPQVILTNIHVPLLPPARLPPLHGDLTGQGPPAQGATYHVAHDPVGMEVAELGVTVRRFDEYLKALEEMRLADQPQRLPQAALDNSWDTTSDAIRVRLEIIVPLLHLRRDTIHAIQEECERQSAQFALQDIEKVLKEIKGVAGKLDNVGRQHHHVVAATTVAEVIFCAQVAAHGHKGTKPDFGAHLAGVPACVAICERRAISSASSAGVYYRACATMKAFELFLKQQRVCSAAHADLDDAHKRVRGKLVEVDDRFQGSKMQASELRNALFTFSSAVSRDSPLRQYSQHTFWAFNGHDFGHKDRCFYCYCIFNAPTGRPNVMLPLIPPRATGWHEPSRCAEAGLHSLHCEGFGSWLPRSVLDGASSLAEGRNSHQSGLVLWARMKDFARALRSWETRMGRDVQQVASLAA